MLCLLKQLNAMLIKAINKLQRHERNDQKTEKQRNPKPNNSNARPLRGTFGTSIRERRRRMVFVVG